MPKFFWPSTSGAEATRRIPGSVGRYAVQQMLSCSDKHIEFHLWYLRAKGFLETTEHGALAITIEGIDHVISTSRSTMKEKLLITQSSTAHDGPGT